MSAPRHPAPCAPDRPDERWARAEPILDEALELDPAGWPTFIARACAGDSALRSEVESLLARAAALDGFLEGLPLEAAPEPDPGPPDDGVAENRRLGPYRIIREIARGGMGCVYLAERADGLFERRVALKVLRPAPDDPDALPRFDAERRILAALEHPGIARLLDAGTTETGRPYLVTEYVEGLPIDRYCRERGLPVRRRIDLFRQVADAVHYAHQNLLVHRDLKPSNILVAPDGRAKLLDFGIAKALDEDAVADAGVLTRPGRQWLTPGYAAPEQLTGRAATTATDVYQLGVLLYELLSGCRPFEAEERDFHRLGQAIRHADPPPPSRAAGPGGGSRRAPRIDADLDAIALKALRKRPEERYPSARALVDDLDRHLAGVPVTARRGTRLYRARKFVRRHRIGTGAGLVISLSVLAGATAAAWQADAARRERDRAREAQVQAELALAQAREVTDILLDVFQAGDPRAGALGDPGAARRLARLGLAHAEGLAGQPLAQASLLDVLARVQLSLDDVAQAESLALRALVLRREVVGLDDPGLAESLNTLALVRKQQGRYREADALHGEALALQRRHLGEAHPEVARTLSLLASHMGDPDLAAAEELRRQALEIRRAALGPAHPLVASSLSALGRIQRSRGEADAAESAFVEALAILRYALGPDHPDVAETMLHLADLVREYRRDGERAESLYREALRIQRAAFGDDYPGLTHGLENLAYVLSDRGQTDTAEALLRESLGLRQRVFGSRHRAVAEGKGIVAAELHRQGRFAEAERLHRDALAVWEQTVGADHWAISGCLHGLGAALIEQGALDEAEIHLRRALEIRQAARGERHAGLTLILGSLGRLRAVARDYEAAEALYTQALEILLEDRTDRHPDVRRLRRELADVYAEWGRAPAARAAMLAEST